MKTTIEVKKETAKRIQIAKHQLGYSNADEVINSIFDIVEKIGDKKHGK
jgi:hypothetical protein